MKWINEHWKGIIAISVAVIAIAALSNVLIRIYLGFDYPMPFSLEGTTIFNNLVTPIAATISAIIFLLISIRQINWMRSDSLKSHYERRFERIEHNLL